MAARVPILLKSPAQPGPGEFRPKHVLSNRIYYTVYIKMKDITARMSSSLDELTIKRLTN